LNGWDDTFDPLAGSTSPSPPTRDQILEEVWEWVNSMTNEELQFAISSGFFEAMGVHISSDWVEAIASGGHIDMNELRQDVVHGVADFIMDAWSPYSGGGHSGFAPAIDATRPNQVISSRDFHLLQDHAYNALMMLDGFRGMMNPVSITDMNGVITIRAFVDIHGLGADYIIPGTNVTYRQAAINGIVEHWTGRFSQGHVETIVTDVRTTTETVPIGQRSAPIVIVNDSGISSVNHWHSFQNPGIMTLYQGDNRSRIYGAEHRYTQRQFEWVVAHEFGHTLGLGDVYDRAGQPQTWASATNQQSIMGSFWSRVSDADIDMVLRAHETNSWQGWPVVPHSDPLPNFGNH